MHPEIFGLDSYIIMAAVGFIAAFLLGMLRRKSYGYRVLDLVAMLCVCIMGLTIGGKLLFIITEIPAIVNAGFTWEIIKSRVINGGLVFYGGLIGAVLCLYWLAKFTKLEARKLLNFAVPCLPFFHLFGRIGCLLDGCCYGVEASWGVARAGEQITRVPIQLFEAAVLFVITAGLLLIEYYAREKQKSYNLLPIYGITYAVARFILEFWRGDILRGVTDINFSYSTIDGGLDGSLTLSTSQFISLAIIAVVLLYWLYLALIKRHDKKLAVSAAVEEAVTPDEIVTTDETDGNTAEPDSEAPDETEAEASDEASDKTEAETETQDNTKKPE